jgi:hypothetical protein
MKFFESFLQKLKKEMKFFSKGFSKYELQRTNGSECAAILLNEVKHPDHYFYLNNNMPIRGLCELSAHLKEMDQETFGNHVNKERNDFAEWFQISLETKLLEKK